MYIGQRLHQAAAEDDGAQQSFAAVPRVGAFAGAGDQVVIGVAEYLFRAGQRLLILAELDRKAAAVRVFGLNHFVDDAQAGGVRGSGEFGADAEYIDGGLGGHKFVDLVFVEIAGGHDTGVLESGVVENFADGGREFGKVAAIDANSPQGASQGGGAAGAFESVIAIDELYSVFAEQSLQAAEGLGFLLEGHDPGMGGGSEDGDSIAHAGFGIAGSGAPTDVSGAASQSSGFGRVGATGAELDHGAAQRGAYDSRRFGGNHGLKSDHGEQVGLGHLGFDQGRAQGEERFAGEHGSAFGRGE